MTRRRPCGTGSTTCHLGRIVLAHDVGRVEDVAEFAAGEAVGTGIPSIKLCAEASAAVFVPGKGWAVIAEVMRETRQRVP